MESRWHRDIEVAQLIDHLKQEDKQDKGGDYDWSRLTKSEESAVLKELDRCRKDFVYAARNYFWITNKDLQDQPLTLNEAQEIILQKLLEIKRKGKPQRLIIIKGRQLGCCLDPKTKILTADLRWIELDDVKSGDELIGVDENIPDGQGGSRKTRKTVVEGRRDVFESAYRLTMDNGQELIATGEHRFLCKRRGGTEAIWRTVCRTKFDIKDSAPIVIGDQIRFFVEPWQEGGWEDAWFGGLMDGEGSLRHRKDCGGFEGNVCQVLDNGIYARAEAYLKSEGYTYRSAIDLRKGVENRQPGDNSKYGSKPVSKLAIHSMQQLMKLIGRTRPTRFINKEWWVGADLPRMKNSWAKVIKIEALGKRRMVDLQTSTKTFIANGFVSHNSTLIEALIAWRTMFFANVHALVVSYDQGHTADVLFPIMTTILDKMPWWLKPMVANRKVQEGLRFDNPKAELRERFPGLDSRVYVKAAGAGAVGAGIRLSAAHISEFCLYEPSVAQKIIDQEMRYALIDNVDTFSILESTGRGANNYTHKLWKNSVQRAERADWYPVFLPAFFEKRRATNPPPDWKIEMPEHLMRARVMDEWVRCDNKKCQQYHMRRSGVEDRAETNCPTCETGILHAYSLTDSQIVFMEDARKNAAHDDESMKKWRQELAVTAQDSFQVEGYQVFGAKAQDFADMSIRKPIAIGDYDSHGLFHGVNHENPRMIDGPLGPFKGCYQSNCSIDHNPEWNECPLLIWEWPQTGALYCFGADVAEGLGGKAAYSAAVMIKYSYSSEPNHQVATWRSNTIDPISYAGKLNSFGRHYNDAMACVEVNKFDSCMTSLRMNTHYPNMYRWKHMDSINPLSNKIGWETNLKSRPRLWMTLRIWLERGLFHVRSENICNEMRNFVKNALDDAYASGDQGEPDDELMACQIGLFCANENLYHDGLGLAAPRSALTDDSARFFVVCRSCGHKSNELKMDEDQMNPMMSAPTMDAAGQIQHSGGLRCRACGGLQLEISRNPIASKPRTDADKWLDQLHGGNTGAALLPAEMDADQWDIPSYDSL